MRIGFLALVTVLLSGCSLFSNPSSMPVGYTYHRAPYNSAPGPEVYGHSASERNSVCSAGCDGSCDLQHAARMAKKNVQPAYEGDRSVNGYVYQEGMISTHSNGAR